MKRILESGRFSNYMNQTRLDSATTEISSHTILEQRFLFRTNMMILKI